MRDTDYLKDKMGHNPEEEISGNAEDLSINTSEERIFKYDESGKLVAEITFPETEPGVYTIDHTFVDDSLRGQGMAGKLVRMAVDEIERRGGKVRATCSYASKWLDSFCYNEK